MNIINLFLKAAKAYPLNMAIIEKDKSINYAELEKEVKSTAAYFLKKGIQKGDRVLVFVPMSIDLYRIVLALFYIGATAVFLDEWVSKKRLEVCCQLADCKGFVGVFKARVFSLFSKELRQIPIKLSMHKTVLQQADIYAVDKNASALITFTTGSTGTPKAADRTHDFLKHQFDALLDEIKPKQSDVDMPVLPIVLFVNLGVGCTSVIADFKMTKPDSMDIASISKQIISAQVNRITASPFFIKKLAVHAVSSAIAYPKIEKIFTGGAPVFPDEAKLYTQAFPDTEANIVYGSTEAEPISSISASDLVEAEKELSIGLPVGKAYHKTTLKIIGISNKNIVCSDESELTQIELNESEIGEIIVSGDHVLKQYFKNEVALKENKIVIGNTIWHRTGDSGLLRNGLLYLTGRSKQLIVKDGKYLSPFIIENKIQTIGGNSFGTLIEHNKQLILVIESDFEIDTLKEKLNDIPFDSLKKIDHVPRDPRHNSKIDYEKLKL